MKKLLQSLNWKNFLHRTLLFFLVFLIIRMLLDFFQNDFSLNRIFQRNMTRYLLFAMVLGILDSETWFTNEPKPDTEKLPHFKTKSAAFIHYLGVAFFISLLCGLILIVFFVIGWFINRIVNNKQTQLFPELNTYLLVIIVIGICFAGYDAWKNYSKMKNRN